jgi:hypothetical protein
MRQIRFRAWDDHNKEMINPYCELKENNHFWGEDMTNTHYISPVAVMQYIGQVDTHKNPIYEGDILRITDESEMGDVNHYFIVTWINEWSIFAALAHYEYPTYLDNGAKKLDESMFWTFTIESDNTFTVCANIYEHPDYIKKCMITEDKSMEEEFKHDEL